MKYRTCPLCKSGRMRPYRDTFDAHGVSIEMKGEKCDSCDEILFDAEEMARMEEVRAYAFAERGIRHGDEFAFVRKQAGYRAVDLAKLLDVSPETISRWEHDVIPIPRAVAATVAQLLLHPKIMKPSLTSLMADA
jgi:putative zinc finger/helix-turn-helix YgiT family protein